MQFIKISNIFIWINPYNIFYYTIFGFIILNKIEEGFKSGVHKKGKKNLRWMPKRML
jgi:hypothetical protein